MSCPRGGVTPLTLNLGNGGSEWLLRTSSALPAGQITPVPFEQEDG
jgi:hypothetical protein